MCSRTRRSVTTLILWGQVKSPEADMTVSFVWLVEAAFDRLADLLSRRLSILCGRITFCSRLLISSPQSLAGNPSAEGPVDVLLVQCLAENIPKQR